MQRRIRQPALEKPGQGRQVKERQQSTRCYQPGALQVLGSRQGTASWEAGGRDKPGKS